MSLCGEPDRPEVQKNIDDLDNNLLTITGEFDKRSRSLEEALERSMYFQEELMVNMTFYSQNFGKNNNDNFESSMFISIRCQGHWGV